MYPSRLHHRFIKRLGLMAGQFLSEQGRAVGLHARNSRRADETERRLPPDDPQTSASLAGAAELGIEAAA